MLVSGAMMKWNVKEIAEAKGYKNARELSDAAGIPLASMYRLWKGTADMVGLATLNKLCGLLDVPVGMLLTYIPDGLLEQQGGAIAFGDREARRVTKSPGSAKSKRATALAGAVG